MRKSLGCSHHDLIKFFKRKFVWVLLACPLDHLFHHLFIVVFIEQFIHFSDILESNVVFVVPIIFLENSINLLFIFFFHGLVCHGLHKLKKRYSSCLLLIIFSYNFINGLLICSIAVLMKQNFEIVWEQNPDIGWIIIIKNLLQHYDIFFSNFSRDIETRIKIS